MPKTFKVGDKFATVLTVNNRGGANRIVRTGVILHAHETIPDFWRVKMDFTTREADFGTLKWVYAADMKRA